MISPPVFYSFLAISTLLIVLLSIATWARTRNPAYLLGFAFIYYWTLYGAWWILLDAYGGDSGMRYGSLDELLFAIDPDRYYLKALLLYALFILVLQTTVLLTGTAAENTPPRRPLTIDHRKLLAIGMGSTVTTFILVRSDLAMAAQMSMSAYAYVSSQSLDGWYTLHQFLNRVALLAPGLGIAIYASGDQARFIRCRHARHALLGYLGIVALMMTLCIVMGNKNELLFALVTSVVFYMCNARWPRIVRLLALGSLLFAVIGTIDYIRYHPIGSILGDLSVDELLAAVGRIGSSNEAFSAHRSLYGALRYDVPLVYGRSVWDLFCAFVPRLFWPHRPEGLYVHYRYYTAMSDGVAGTIHHATGWYLNFGVTGICFGAGLLGWIWTWLHNAQHRYDRFKSIWMRALAAVTPAAFTGMIPQIIRSGIGGYKGIVFLAILAPTAIVALSAIRERATVEGVRRRPLGSSGPAFIRVRRVRWSQ